MIIKVKSTPENWEKEKEYAERLKMIEIKFSHEYLKFCGKKLPFEATLVQCFKVTRRELSRVFIAYDTHYDEGQYHLPEGDLIVLLLMDDDRKLFTTIRSYDMSKWVYYKAEEGMDVMLVKG